MICNIEFGFCIVVGIITLLLVCWCRDCVFNCDCLLWGFYAWGFSWV